MNKRDRKFRLFRQGVAAIKGAGIDTKGRYVCPICCRCFTSESIDNKVLTIEHVPPKSVGGKELVLTCKFCNEKGSGLEGYDTHAKNLQNIEDLFTFKKESDLKVKVSVGDTWVPARVRSRNGWWEFKIAEKRPPGAWESIKSKFRRARDSAPQLKVIGRGADSDKASVSALKAAYLGSFAALGYSYIFQDIMKPLRQIILGEESSLFKVSDFFFYAGKACNNVALIEKPEWVQGLLVTVNDRHVILPLIDELPGFYRRLADRAGSATLSLSGQALGWPKPPSFELDLNPGGAIAELFRTIVNMQK